MNKPFEIDQTSSICCTEHPIGLISSLVGVQSIGYRSNYSGYNAMYKLLMK